MAYTATIVRDRKYPDRYYIRISKDGVQDGGDVEIVEILHGDDEDELKQRALRFIGHPHIDWPQ